MARSFDCEVGAFIALYITLLLLFVFVFKPTSASAPVVCYPHDNADVAFNAVQNYKYISYLHENRVVLGDCLFQDISLKDAASMFQHIIDQRGISNTSVLGGPQCDQVFLGFDMSIKGDTYSVVFKNPSSKVRATLVLEFFSMATRTFAVRDAVNGQRNMNHLVAAHVTYYHH